ncbi:MAG TPA: HAD-IA family hydrolase [Armatimonadota bacterium]|jgi:putative hydrolase of the HAD superfamily
MIKAVFLDRDGVICHRHERRSEERNRAAAEMLGRPDLHITAEDEIRIFWKAHKETPATQVVTPEQEDAFWWRWGELLLSAQGMADGADAARELCARYPYYSMLEAYPDVSRTLEALRKRGYRLAIISNTFPSLKASIEAMDLGEYFVAFVSSALAGVEKPDPAIYRIALETIGVSAEESVFVDDLAENADAARELGFTSFRLDRRSEHADWDAWTIHSLDDVVMYLEEHGEL